MPTPPVILSLNRSNYPEIMDLWESSVRATHHFLRPLIQQRMGAKKNNPERHDQSVVDK